MHRVALQRVHRSGDGQIGLAGTGGADADGDVVAGDVVEVAGLVAAAGFEVGAAGSQAGAVGVRRLRLAAEHQLHCLGLDGAGRDFIQGLQNFHGPVRRRFGPFDLELLMPVRNTHTQRGFHGTQMGVGGTAQMA